MAVKLHRCSVTFYKHNSHPCWRVEKALRDQGIDFEAVTMLGLPRSKRETVIEKTGQNRFPAIEFEDGTWYREESAAMVDRIRAGGLFAGESSDAGGGDEPPAAA